MNTTSTRTHRLANGLTIVGEPLPDKQAVAWNFLIPAGSATEPGGREGISNVLESLVQLGAGERDSRQLSDALDDLGIDRGGGADTEYTTFGGATLGEFLPPSLELYADIILRPRLPEDEWEAQRDLALQNLASLEDSPASKMFVQLRRVYFPNSFGRSPMGTESGLNALSLDDLRADHAARYKPQGAILAVAGSFEWDKVVAQAEDLFGAWSGAAPEAGAATAVEGPQYIHISHESAQHHIGLAYAGAKVDDADFYAYRLAASVLSGGMGARLFTELREKEGLCYSVSASPSSVRGCGFMLSYVGTQPERAQRSLDKLIEEITRMKDGVTEDELERARVKMLSSLVMQEESSRARAGSIARDQWVLGRVRPTDEILDAINKVTTDDIRAYYEAHPPRNFTIVTLGPSALDVA
jgi:predicted Zn-dependent peptidase